ncbi:hypothetical protein CPB86DRAFT_610706 [Serendipita vermifera]|nr:hypothetical protein CPB86DRAFT_610706 [Serendipita vermifera]
MKYTVASGILLALVSEVLAVGQYGQCGGIGYTGSTTCDSPFVCTRQNDYYSQCLPGSSSNAPTTTTTTKISTTTTTSSGGSSTTGSLAQRMKAKGKKYFGTCSDSALLSNSQNAAVIKAQFNQLTPENSMKWETIEATQGSFNFAEGDTLVTFARQNGDLVRLVFSLLEDYSC